ncbi:MAG: hypothetical protein HY243_12400 [Proteobacteria bacterium]|nr:hypothetical protein [Pseudomonadota bacterium]
MRINISGNVRNLNGEDVTEEGVPLTIRAVIVNSLLGQFQAEIISGVEKLRRFKLAEKISGNASEVDLTAEDVVLIKDQVAKHYSPLAVGRVYERLCI